MTTPAGTCTATFTGRHLVGGGTVQCTRDAYHPGNHVGPKRGSNGRALWEDHGEGATPHCDPASAPTSPEPTMPEPDTTPAACVWPDCLTDAQQAQLADEVVASMHGEATTPMPDQRPICGCTEAPPANQGRSGQ